ncbi:hypothetical protein LBMAG53_13680 [Planctomycetota bacterium]|nr:hypothetical protein LBMAG53_13680 [Planctomycetota bacterium]
MVEIGSLEASDLRVFGGTVASILVLVLCHARGASTGRCIMSLAWIADAVLLPLAFAQVREDPLVDLALLGGPGSRVLMIASGGCTVARLAADPRVELIHAVDPNPAQLALARLKVSLLSSGSSQRRQVLGRQPMAVEARQRALAGHLEALGLAAASRPWRSDWVRAVITSLMARIRTDRAHSPLQIPL